MAIGRCCATWSRPPRPRRLRASAIELAIADNLPAVAGDEAALRRVFQNLVGNAIKYGADARWIGMTAPPSGDTLEISVSDRGIGIAAADQATIFDPFYRAPDVVAAQIQGAGLGPEPGEADRRGARRPDRR